MIGLLLAAGSGRRFGGDKLLAELPDGTPVGLASARALAPAVDRLLIGVRADDGDLLSRFMGAGYRGPTHQCAPIEHAECGMGHTLGVLVRSTAFIWPDLANPALIVALADMPAVQVRTYAAIADRLRAGASLVRPVWHGRPGHPVGFAASWYAALAASQGDVGARELLVQAGAECELLDCADPGVLLDIDTAMHLAEVSRLFSLPPAMP